MWTSVKVKSKKYFYFSDFLLKSSPCWLTSTKLSWVHWGHTKLFNLYTLLHNLCVMTLLLPDCAEQYCASHHIFQRLLKLSWEWRMSKQKNSKDKGSKEKANDENWCPFWNCYVRPPKSYQARSMNPWNLAMPIKSWRYFSYLFCKNVK